MEKEGGVCIYIGDYQNISESNVVINGDYNNVSGSNCEINGDYNNVSGSNCIIHGYYNTISGDNCESYGDYNTKRERKREKITKYVEGPAKFELQYDEPAKTCCICLENVPNCIASPCMHMIYCVACARILCFGSKDKEENLKQHGEVSCAECRKEVHSIKRVF